jgi:transcriptional regulator with XRE-family HTH domain
MTFAEKTRALLKAQRLSQSELAERLGTNQPQVCRWLEANTPPRGDYLLKLARVLGVTADYLIDPDQEEPPKPAVLPDDERYLLQLYRDLGLSREEAARALAGAARVASQTAQGDAWVPGPVRDLSRSEDARQRERGRSAKRPPSEREPNGQDEGSNPDHAPGRVR